ncbi:MAG: PA14 domain-containing protein [Planctomycetota bacterium]
MPCPLPPPPLLRLLAACTVAIILLSQGLEAQRAPRERDLQPGAVFEGYDIGKAITRVPLLEEGQLPNVSKIIPDVNFIGQTNNFAPLVDRFMTRIHGYLRIRKSGVYEFRLRSDDGSVLTIGETKLIDHDGMHGATGRSAEVRLKKGYHPFLIEHFDGGGADALVLDWRLRGMKEFQVAPSQLFYAPKMYDHATAAGAKKIVEGPPTEGLSHEAAIDRAVQLGSEYLLAELERRLPFLEEGSKNFVGQTAIETYALIVSGIPIDHPTIRRALEYIDHHVLDKKNTYALACALFAHDAAIAQLELDEMLVSPGVPPAKILQKSTIGREHRREIQRLGEALLDAQNKTGGWRYFPHEQTADISCIQFAILGLGIAAKRGVAIPPEAWTRAAEFIVALQAKDGPPTSQRLTLTPEEQRNRDEIALIAEEKERKHGGPGKRRGGGSGVSKTPRDPIVGTETLRVLQRPFAYMPGTGHQPTMNAEWNRTCAAVSSLLLIHDQLGSSFPRDKTAELFSSIRDGYGWMMEHWNPYPSFYGIYSLEKVADLGHIQKFGDRDWYDEATKHLIGRQTRDGSWPSTGMHGENPRVTTSLALLVLKRATSLLTRNPGERIIFTGGGQAEARRADREWVYLPEHDTCIHFPQLQEVLRLRPKKKLLVFLETVITHYPEDFRPETVPTLLELKGRVSGRAAQKLLARCLETAVGRSLDEDAAYGRWHDQWARVVHAGANGDASVIPELVEAYGAPHSTLLMKRAAARAAVRLGAKDLIPHLLEDLNSESKQTRSFAYHSLRGFYGEAPPPFDPEGSKRDRSKQIEQLRAWVAERA